MPSIRVDDCHGLWRDTSVICPSEKCAPEVYLNTERRHARPSALLFFTIPNFRTGGRVRLNAPVCRTGVLFAEPTEVQILPRASSVLREPEVTVA